MSFFQHVRTVSHASVNRPQIIPFPASCMALNSLNSNQTNQRSYADHWYIMRVILYLERMRKARKMSRRDLARRSGLSMSLIRRAEQGVSIPKSKDFKAWAEALGLSWEQVWSECLPKKSGS
jgi:ribosome-binding protein aMBF1 (putative translation factor)